MKKNSFSVFFETFTHTFLNLVKDDTFKKVVLIKEHASIDSSRVKTQIEARQKAKKNRAEEAKSYRAKKANS